MKILICGDRNWSDYWAIYDVVSKLDRNSIIIHGAAKGADTMAGTIASKLGFKVVAFKANWERYGKAAGPIRNREMLDVKPDLVIAFHNDIENSKGTKDCIKEAEKRSIEVKLVSTIK